MLYYNILYYTIPYYTILYHTILYYTVLCQVLTDLAWVDDVARILEEPARSTVPGPFDVVPLLGSVLGV